MRYVVLDRSLTLKLTLQQYYTDYIQVTSNKAQSLPSANTVN